MPLKPLAAALCGLCLAGQAQATTSIWAPQATPQAALLGDYHAVSCEKTPPPAYTGPLQLQSKYDQSDVTKSTLSGRQDASTKQIQAQVKTYIGGLIQASKYFQRAKDGERATLAVGCFDQWLEAWARGGALLNPDASSTGMAGRKWALAAIAGSVLRVQALSDGRFRLSTSERDWLQRLAERVIAEYQPRRTAEFRYFNNHDYWAGWAVSATGMALGRDDFIAWGDGSLRRALQQITPSTHGDYAYLPLEVARGKLASTYTQYALVPLMLLVETAEANGRPLSPEEQHKLQQLATFAARAAMEPDTLDELGGQSQEDPAIYKLVWLLPFLARYPQHPWARKLYQEEDGEVDNYSQIGGAIKPFYPRAH